MKEIFCENKIKMIGDIFRNLLEICPQKGITFISENGGRKRLSYFEIAKLARKRGEYLKSAGCKPKDFIIFQTYKDIDFTVDFWACMFFGFVPVLMNPVFDMKKNSAEGETLKSIYAHLEKPKILVGGGMHEEYKKFAENLGIETQNIICGDEYGEFEGENPIPTENYLKDTDIALIFLTSGTTGVPKCVMQTNKAAVAREAALQEVFDYENMIFLNWMPLEHPGGVLMAHLNAVSNCGEQIQVEKGYILQNITRWFDLMEELGANWSWAPHFAYVLLKKEAEKQNKKWDLSKIVQLLNGGEMVDAKTGKEFVNYFKKFGLQKNVLQPAWGMCETCSGVLYNNDFDFEGGGIRDFNGRILTAIGKPLPKIQVRIADENDNPLQDGEVGVFQIKGDEVTLGYYKNDAENAKVFTKDGWFNTGDAGFIAYGSVILTGREKDVVIINGLNYANAEIESVIDGIDEVKNSCVAVCQCANKNGDEEVVAFFTPSARTEPVCACEKALKTVKKKLRIDLTKAIAVPEEEISKSNLEKIQRAKIAKKYSQGYFESFENALTEKKNFAENTAVPNWFLTENFVERPAQIYNLTENVRLQVSLNYLKEMLLQNVCESENGETIVFQGDFEELKSLGKQIAKGEIKCRRLVYLTENMYCLDENEKQIFDEGEIAGFLKCLAAESGVQCVNIDLDDFSNEESIKTALCDIFAENIACDTVAVRGGKRYELKLENVDFEKENGGFTYGGLYIITGGLGGIGRLICKYLLKFYNAKIVILGRRNIEQDGEYKSVFENLQSIGDDVFYEKANAADYENMKNVAEKYEKKFRCEISEIIHAAGMGNLKEHWREKEKRLIANCDDELYKKMLEAKKTGTENLYKIAEQRKGARLVLCGSTNGFFGTASFGAYSAANSFLRTFAFSKRGKEGKVLCINFSSWKNTGLSFESGFENLGANKGFYDIEEDSGALSIEKRLKTHSPSVFVGLNPEKNYIKKYMAQGETQNITPSKKEEIVFDENDLRLANIWEKILGVKAQSHGDDFFELGGESIKAFVLPKEIKSEFGIDFNAKDVFRFSRFDEMKKIIEERLKI